jgi:hypothetical protein
VSELFAVPVDGCGLAAERWPGVGRLTPLPPSGPDRAYQQRFAPLGLLEPVSPYADCPPSLAQALTAGAGAAP